MTERKKIFIGVAVATVAVLPVVLPMPNSLRSQIPPGHGAQPSGTIRSLITTEVTYLVTYPKMGYAPNLATLGPDVADGAQCRPSPEHACLFDFGCPTGVGTAWCVKGEYLYNIQTSSSEPPYKDYWITATPVRGNPELMNYCSLSDAVLRYEKAAPLSRPYTIEECESLPKLAN